MSRTVMMRLAILCGVAGAGIGLAWLSWPRPTLTIVVQPGGGAVVLPRYASALRAPLPLPDTVQVPTGALVRVINHDTAATHLGLFGAAPGGDEMSRGPTLPGRLLLACSAHPGRHILWVIGSGQRTDGAQ